MFSLGHKVNVYFEDEYILLEDDYKTCFVLIIMWVCGKCCFTPLCIEKLMWANILPELLRALDVKIETIVFMKKLQLKLKIIKIN